MRHHSLAGLAGIDWRSRPELDQLARDEFLGIVRAAWTPERRLQARAAAVRSWRARNPDRAAAIDAILATDTPGGCDCCGLEPTQLVTGNYRTRADLWRCASCVGPSGLRTVIAGPLPTATAIRDGASGGSSSRPALSPGLRSWTGR